MNITDALNSRIQHASESCNLYYNQISSDARRISNSSLWTQNYHKIKSLLKDMTVLEIGCGYFGGLSNMVLESGAKCFIGNDIDKNAVESSQRAVPGVYFVHDDPVYILNILNKMHFNVLTISSDVFDNKILSNYDYMESLVDAISRTTPIGGYSIHSGHCISSQYNSIFKKFGLESITDHLTDLEIYRRVEI